MSEYLWLREKKKRFNRIMNVIGIHVLYTNRHCVLCMFVFVFEYTHIDVNTQSDGEREKVCVFVIVYKR